MLLYSSSPLALLLCGALRLAFCIKFRSMSQSLANSMRLGCFVAFVLVVRLGAKPVSCAIGRLRNPVCRLLIGTSRLPVGSACCICPSGCG